MSDTLLINAIIVDDNKNCIDVLSKDLMRFPDIKVLEATTSVKRAKAAILKYQPTVLFLDVEMPEQTGFDFLQEISPYAYPGMCVVLYSAFDKYMIDALRASAFDFLLKPYQPEELNFIINRVRSNISSGRVNFEPSKYQALDSTKKFGIHTISGAILLSKADVLYFEYISIRRCWQLKLTNFTVHRLQTTTTSKEILNINPSFVQISRECIINIDYLSSIDNKYECSLYPPFQNIKIRASRRYYSLLKDSLDFF